MYTGAPEEIAKNFATQRDQLLEQQRAETFGVYMQTLIDEYTKKGGVRVLQKPTAPAGLPIGADIGSDAYVVLDRVLFSPAPDYLLKVKGDSMVEAAICDGDFVVIRQQKNAEKGEIVAAMIDGEATVKTFSKKDGHYWLLPANPDFAPIPADNAEILGKVVAVLRSVK